MTAFRQTARSWTVAVRSRDSRRSWSISLRSGGGHRDRRLPLRPLPGGRHQTNLLYYAWISTAERQLEFAILATHATCTKLGFSYFRLLEQDSESRENYSLVNTQSIALPDTPVASLIAQFSNEALEGSKACEPSDDEKLDASLEKTIPKAIQKWEKREAKQAAKGGGS